MLKGFSCDLGNMAKVKVTAAQYSLDSVVNLLTC